MDEIAMKQRTKAFALRSMKLADSLPLTNSGRTVGGQLVRSAASAAASYRSACRGRSKAEFTAKLGIVEKEADELVRIRAASIRTARTQSQIQNPES